MMEKEVLYKSCLEHVDNRIAEFKLAISSAKESGIDDVKSSAGDKYETGREMMQQQVSQYSRQLEDAEGTKQILLSISPKTASELVRIGSIVNTNFGNFYIAVSLGKLIIGKEEYFVISPSSPIGSKMMGLKAGAKFDFNGKAYKIEKAW